MGSWMFGFSRLFRNVAWAIVCVQITLVIVDQAEMGSIPEKDMAQLSICALFGFYVGFNVDLLIWFTPVFVSLGLTYGYLLQRNTVSDVPAFGVLLGYQFLRLFLPDEAMDQVWAVVHVAGVLARVGRMVFWVLSFLHVERFL